MGWENIQPLSVFLPICYTFRRRDGAVVSYERSPSVVIGIAVSFSEPHA